MDIHISVPNINIILTKEIIYYNLQYFSVCDDKMCIKNNKKRIIVFVNINLKLTKGQDEKIIKQKKKHYFFPK